jgi:hypothetical protein
MNTQHFLWTQKEIYRAKTAELEAELATVKRDRDGLKALVENFESKDAMGPNYWYELGARSARKADGSLYGRINILNAKLDDIRTYVKSSNRPGDFGGTGLNKSWLLKLLGDTNE